MIKLKSLAEDEKESISSKVGGGSFYLQATSHHNVFNQATNTLTVLIGDKYKSEIKMFVANVVASLKKCDEGFTYTRDKNKYATYNKANPKVKPVSYRRLMPLFDILEDLGYINVYCGYKDIKANESASACVTFNRKLILMFDEKDIVNHAPFLTKDSVVVRDSDGNEIKGITGIVAERKKIDELNTWLRGVDFKFGGYSRVVQLQSVYNENLETSGRLFFGGLQCLKSIKRRSILIKDSPVTEHDWCSQHYCIIACLLGVSLPKNFKPYEIDVRDLLTMKEGYCEVKARKILKLACMMLINSGNPTTSMKNLWDTHMGLITDALAKGDFKSATSNPFYGVSGKANCSAIIKRLKEHNSYAKTMFNRKGGLWGYLQNIDKKIMVETLFKMKSHDCPALPYHDSLVCRVQDKEILLEAMRDSWFKVLGTYDNCYIDQKY